MRQGGMMRDIFRKAVTVLLALAFVLMALTLETVADELGYVATVRAFAKGGWRAVTDAGYATLLVSVFWLLLGATLASWAEWGIRKWEARKRIQLKADLLFERKDGNADCVKTEGVAAAFVVEGQAWGGIRRSDPKISRNAFTVAVVFSEDLPEPAPYVYAERNVIWRELKGDSRFMVLEIDPLGKEDFAFGIIIRPLAWSKGWRNTIPLKWSDAPALPRATVLDPGRGVSQREGWLGRLPPWLRSKTKPGTPPD
jgi:hypothetical protein